MTLVLAGVFAAVASVPIAPADFWWHLKAGEMLLDGDGFLVTDTWSFTVAREPFIHQAWLAGAVFAAVYRVGGLEWLAVGNAALFTLGYGLVLLRCRDLTADDRLAAAATAVAFALSVENWVLRPQSFSVLLLPLVLLLVGRYADGRLRARWLVALPLVVALWANLHGAFALGIVVPGVAGAMLVVQRRTSVGLPLIAAAGGSALAACINPWGVEIYGYLWTISTTTALRSFVLEWAPTDLTFLPGKVLAGVLVLLLVRLVWARRFPMLQELGLLLVFLVVALNAVRSVIWFGMVVAPVLARPIPPGPPSLTPRRPTPPPQGRGERDGVGAALAGFPTGDIEKVSEGAPSSAALKGYGGTSADDGPSQASSPSTPLNSRSNLGHGIFPVSVFSPLPWGGGVGRRGVREGGPGGIGRLALLCILLMPLVTTPWVRAVLPLPPERRGAVSADTPIAVARALAELPPGRRTFHDMQYGSYLIWATAPRQPVFIDPRIELYPFGQWADYGTIAAGLNVAPLLDRYQINTLLLDRRRQAGLLAVAAGDPAWTQVYADPSAVIFRRTEENAP